MDNLLSPTMYRQSPQLRRGSLQPPNHRNEEDYSLIVRRQSCPDSADKGPIERLKRDVGIIAIVNSVSTLHFFSKFSRKFKLLKPVTCFV